jgi:hypothetical protein
MVDSYMQKVSGLNEHYNRCFRTEGKRSISGASLVRVVLLFMVRMDEEELRKGFG